MYRVHLAVGVVFVAYCAGALLPAESFWFNPEPPVFGNSIEGHRIPLVRYSRTIHTDATIGYVAIVREVGEAPPACTGEEPPFPFVEATGPVVGRDLTWWTGHSHDCEVLPAGTYWARTTWTIDRPLEAFLPDFLDPLLGGILPPKRITRDSPSFIIHEDAPHE